MNETIIKIVNEFKYINVLTQSNKEVDDILYNNISKVLTLLSNLDKTCEYEYKYKDIINNVNKIINNSMDMCKSYYLNYEKNFNLFDIQTKILLNKIDDVYKKYETEKQQQFEMDKLIQNALQYIIDKRYIYIDYSKCDDTDYGLGDYVEKEDYKNTYSRMFMKYYSYDDLYQIHYGEIVQNLSKSNNYGKKIKHYIETKERLEREEMERQQEIERINSEQRYKEQLIKEEQINSFENFLKNRDMKHYLDKYYYRK